MGLRGAEGVIEREGESSITKGVHVVENLHLM